jgi:hypothetical protein
VKLNAVVLSHNDERRLRLARQSLVEVPGDDPPPGVQGVVYARGAGYGLLARFWNLNGSHTEEHGGRSPIIKAKKLDPVVIAQELEDDDSDFIKVAILDEVRCFRLLKELSESKKGPRLLFPPMGIEKD